MALDQFREALALGYQNNILLKGWITQAQEEIVIAFLEAPTG